MMSFNILGATDYSNLRFNTIFNVEENRNIKLQPYLDGAGIPTIGIGMNLQEK